MMLKRKFQAQHQTTPHRAHHKGTSVTPMQRGVLQGKIASTSWQPHDATCSLFAPNKQNTCAMPPS
jgi:hypothetical protein